MFIQQVILENFMSYEYARIPFKSGVNVVCGPNGAGKSSILLGISVALGQSYTERSKKLSALIRRGKDRARVTLILDNTIKNGRRPISRFNKDQIFLTRGLRRDGKYWFELDNKAATREDVNRLLSKLGVDADNMLIIMHQNMVEQFTVLSPQEKLRMVEAAVGFESYRRNILDAQRKLSQVLSEEQSLEKLLESAEQNLTYWRSQYDRYQQKKQLIIKRRFLNRELTWAQIVKKEKTANDLQDNIRNKRDEITRIEEETKKTEAETIELQTKRSRMKEAFRELVKQRLEFEYEKARHESNLKFSDQRIKETRTLLQTHREQMKSFLTRLEQYQTTPRDSSDQKKLETELIDAKNSFEEFGNAWSEQLNNESEDSKQKIADSSQHLTKLGTRIQDVETRMDNNQTAFEKDTGFMIDYKVRLAMLNYRKMNLTKELAELNKELEVVFKEIDNEKKLAEELGPRIVPIKGAADILDEIRLTDGHIAALTDVSEEIERMYESYSKLHLELKDKAQMVAENREKALAEIETRLESWRTVLHKLLDQVNLQFQTILTRAQAEGEVRLFDERDIEAAGLQIFVGFKGAKPVPLDAYTQSGGERSTATMTFLLALQQHVKSPFRAVDEYDVHMDPKNREVVAKLLVSSINGQDSQYLAITPSQISYAENNVHVITVQNAEGSSVVKELV